MDMDVDVGKEEAKDGARGALSVFTLLSTLLQQPTPEQTKDKNKNKYQTLVTIFCDRQSMHQRSMEDAAQQSSLSTTTMTAVAPAYTTVAALRQHKCRF